MSKNPLFESAVPGFLQQHNIVMSPFLYTPARFLGPGGGVGDGGGGTGRTGAGAGPGVKRLT